MTYNFNNINRPQQVMTERYRMITKNDCLILLNEIKDVDTSSIINKLLVSNTLDYEVIEFINTHRELDLSKFYYKLRKSYNRKKSKLYINIVKSDEDNNMLNNTITTLTALLNQITLFAKDVDDINMFYKHARVLEILKALESYYKTGSMTLALKVLHIIKLDLKVLEYTNKK